jgi:D-alanyl-D-alanine carboxypeptidase/D-alanyl-D-alanine-endopeptidase (penicillin-binding protein 4)
LDDPRKVAGFVLAEALLARGVRVAETVALGKSEDLPILVTHRSEPLMTLLPRLGKDSDNFSAEMLLKTLGARASGVGSSEAGSKVLLDTLGSLGLVEPSLRWVNGSGLFDANRISTNLLVRMLGMAYADPSIAPEYLSQLSRAGVDGTLTKRLRNLPKGCIVRAKTGTLRTVISLAGYIHRTDGKALGFAIIAEGVDNQASTRQQIDRFIESLCNP